LSGEVPFYGENDIVIAERIKLGQYQFECNIFVMMVASVWDTITEECKDLINKILMPAESRINLQDMLEHEWFKKMEEDLELPQLPANRLKKFNSAHKVKKVIFKYLSTELGISKIEELRNWFLQIDKCGDGILSVEEIRKGLNDFSQKELEPWMEVLDITGEGLIEYDSNLTLTLVFIAIALWKLTCEFNSRLREGFQVFDKDGDGKIDSNEMKEVVGKELGESYTEFWSALLKEADKNGDGKIDFYEFKKLLYPSNAY